jgi:hypothetical protein
MQTIDFSPAMLCLACLACVLEAEQGSAWAAASITTPTWATAWQLWCDHAVRAWQQDDEGQPLDAHASRCIQIDSLLAARTHVPQALNGLRIHTNMHHMSVHCSMCTLRQ